MKPRRNYKESRSPREKNLLHSWLPYNKFITGEHEKRKRITTETTENTEYTEKITTKESYHRDTEALRKYREKTKTL